MDQYIGVKVVSATPMTYEEYIQKPVPGNPTEGYLLHHTGTHTSWLDKATFEKYHHKIHRVDEDGLEERDLDSFIKIGETHILTDRVVSVSGISKLSKMPIAAIGRAPLTSKQDMNRAIEQATMDIKADVALFLRYLISWGVDGLQELD